MNYTIQVLIVARFASPEDSRLVEIDQGATWPVDTGGFRLHEESRFLLGQPLIEKTKSKDEPEISDLAAWATETITADWKIQANFEIDPAKYKCGHMWIDEGWVPIDSESKPFDPHAFQIRIAGSTPALYVRDTLFMVGESYEAPVDVTPLNATYWVLVQPKVIQ